MWRRESKVVSDAPSAAEPGHADLVSSGWDVWEEKWARPEEERVARWLMAKGGSPSTALGEQDDRPLVALHEEPVSADRDHQPLALESERSDLHERLRQLVSAVEAEQVELERVRGLRTEVLAELEAAVSALDEQHRRLEESIAAAEARAEEARLAEGEAMDRAKAAREQADKVEAERFEVWVALDAEITSLESRRGGTDGTS